jgi:hypothetical protein
MTSKDSDRTSRDIISLELSETLRQEEVVDRYEFNPRTQHITLELNHKYEGRTVISPLVKGDWPRTIDKLNKEMERKGIDEKHRTMICDVADDNAPRILEIVKVREAFRSWSQ